MKQFDYIKRWYSDPARAQGQVVRPRQLNFPVTDNCNARCVMCDVWKENVLDDMSVEQLRAVLAQPFFRNLEHVGISGGEPFLRADLLQVVEAFCELPKLASLSITSHGFNFIRHQMNGPKIVALAKQRGVPFTINISIDGVGEVHDRVRRVPNGFIKLQRTIDLYRDMGVRVLAQCTVSKYNLYNLAELDAWIRERGIDIIYRISTTIERLANGKTMESVELDANERSFFADFLAYSGVIERTSNPARRLFYRQLVDTLQTNARRAAPCYYQNEAVLLSSRGDVFQCSIVDNAVCNALETNVDEQYFSPENLMELARTKAEVCARCPHDQTGAWAPQALIAEQLRSSKVGGKMRNLPELADKVVTTAISIARPMKMPVPVPPIAIYSTAVVIGCYGGEHVGDAAILGGVLLRLHQTYGTTRAIVLSSRVDRTEGWAGMLDVPLAVEVWSYDHAAIKLALTEANALVIGGGPVMDLPALLARHIEASGIACGLGLPVIAEGIGFGPFRRESSRRLAKKLLAATSVATLRTGGSFEKARALSPHVTRTIDPAFTYLAQINATAPAAPAWIAARRRPGRPLVALNLRPLWTRYATVEFDDSRVQQIEKAALAALAGLINARPDCYFVFLPFNADQLGMSDLNIAYDLKASGLLHGNFEIWENEPGISEMVGALRACDALIAMRFHACIFGISAGCPVFGIDYGIGKKSKVAELIEDNEGSGEVMGVEMLDTATLMAFLSRIESSVTPLVDGR